jgi:hypothetical protein
MLHAPADLTAISKFATVPKNILGAFEEPHARFETWTALVGLCRSIIPTGNPKIRFEVCYAPAVTERETQIIVSDIFQFDAGEFSVLGFAHLEPVHLGETIQNRQDCRLDVIRLCQSADVYVYPLLDALGRPVKLFDSMNLQP